MKKYILSFIISLLAGVNAAWAQDSYNVWVGGTQITSANVNDVLGNGTVSYNSTTNTLTLDNAYYSGEGYESSAIYATGDLNIVVTGTNSLTSTAANGFGIYTGGSLTVTGSGSDPTLNVTAASTGFAIKAAGSSASFDGITMALAGNRGIVVNENNTSDAISIENCTITFANGTKRAIQVYNDTGDASVIISGSSLTGAGEILAYGYGTSGGDATLTIDNSTIDITGNTEQSRHGIELLSNYGDAILTIRNHSNVTVKTSNGSDAINVGSQHELNGKGKCAVDISDSDVNLDGARCGLTAFSWCNTGNVQGTTVSIANSTATIIGGQYYGLYAYSYESGNAAITITGSTVSASAPYMGVEMAIDTRNYDIHGSMSYTQTNSDVTLSGGYYGLDVDSSSKTPVEGDGNATVTITGGTLISNGGLYVFGDTDGTVTMEGVTATIDVSNAGVAPIATDNLIITSGAYSILGSDGTDIYGEGITGGLFSVDVSNACADGYVCVANTDAGTSATYPYVVEHVKVAEVYNSNGDLIDQYTSFADAWVVANANAGSTLKMLEPDDVTSQLEASGTFTLDFNGKQLQYIGTSVLNSGVILVLRGAHLTLEDTNFDPADPETVLGGIVSDIISYNTNPNDPAAVITVEAIHEWYGDVKYAYAAVALTKLGESATGDAAKLTVNGGELYGHYYGITGNGSRHNTEITINGGVIQGSHEGDNLGIYHPQNGMLTITGGEITGYSSAIEVRSGTLNVTGGTFETTATSYSCNPNGSGTTTVGAAIAIAQHKTNQPINATISGGTFTIPSTGNAVKLSVSNPENNTFSNVSVSGLTALIGESNKIPDGYMWVEANGISTLSKAVAKIGNVNYATLAAAFAAAQDGETITLLANCTGNGISVPQGKFTTGLTVDFNNFTYTVDADPLAGSPGTQSQAFQLLKNNTITFKNGTIYSEKARMLVQNYSNLTLENMTLTLNNTEYTSPAYTLSNNNGNVVIDGCTINANNDNSYAFDVCRYASYPSVNVTVKGESVINGNVEISASGNDAKDGFSLMLEEGTLNGDIVVDASAAAAMAATPDKATVSKQNTFNQDAPDGYVWKDNGDGTSTLVVAVAKIGDVGYATLADAVTAASDGATIEVIADGPMGGRATIDGKTITIIGAGTIDASGNTNDNDDGITVKNGGVLNLNTTTNQGNITFDGGSTYHSAGIFQTEGNGTVNMYDGISVKKYNSNTEGYVQIKGNGDVFNMYGGSLGSSDDAATFGITVGTRGETTTGVFNLYGGTITGSENEYWPVSVISGTFNMAGGNVIGANPDYEDAAIIGWFDGMITISGGKVNGLVDKTEDSETPFTGSIQLSGGTYTVQPNAAYIVENYLAHHNDATNTDPETWTIILGVAKTATRAYETFAEAADETGDGDHTITLLQDVSADDTYQLTEDKPELRVIKGNFTLDDANVTAVDGYVVSVSTDANGVTTYRIETSPVQIIHDGNTTTDYATLAAAFSAVQNGETIKLMTDVTLTADITPTNNGTFTLDFNGHSINNGNYHVKLAIGQAVLTAEETQLFTPADPVNYVVVKQASGDNTYPYKYNVVKSLTSPDITITVANVTYDGLYHGVDGQNPVSVTVYDANVPGELLAGTDGAYTISMVPASSYSLVGFGNSADNVYKYARTYTDAIIIEGKPEAGYSGRITLDFTIEPRNINDVTVVGHHQSYSETGYTADDNATTGIKKLVTLKYNNIPLVASTANTIGDYTIDVDATMTYKEEGTYLEAITLTAAEGGNFTGSRKVNFYIGNVAGIDIATCNVEATTVYNGSAQTPTGTGTTPTLIVRDGSTNAVLVQGTDYTITTKSETGYEYINAKTYTDAITISGIGNYYGAKTVDYIITPKDIASCTVNASTPFTGSVINPANVVTVQDGTTPLVVNTDYTLTVSNGYTYHDPQTYTGALTITGTGNYTGTVIKDFTITTDNGINIADGKLLVTSNAIYTGATQVPSATTITVQYDGAVLPAENYDITYAPDNVQNGTETGYKDAQTYSRAITITARGTAYYGSVTADYVIAPRNMNEVTATEEHPMEWTGNVLTPVINGDATATNNINLAYGNYKLVANDTKVDYTYTSDPAIIKDPGTYTITFEGRGNFTGTKQLTVHVLKSINNDDVILAENIYIVPNSNNPITPNNIVVKDGANTLAQGPDYTIGIYTDEACTNEVNSITTETLKNSSDEDVAGLIFYVKLTGNDGNSYKETKIIPIYTLREYLPGTLNSTATATPIDLHAAGLSSTANTVNVALGNSAGNNVIAQTTTSLTVPATATVTLNNKAGNATTAQEITLNITDIENDAFTGCTALRWIDGTALPASFTPSSLERSVSGTTFSGVPKQALVYLPGTTFTGENYVYKPGDGDTYYCEKFKIYDDLSGSQTGFTGDDYKWAYENIHPFMAYTIENTRMLTAGKHYTTCLPYTLAIPAGMKAYTLDATSDKLFGFSEVTGIISAFTPYVLIPSKSGQLLSTVTTTVPVFTENAEGTESKLNPTQKGSFTLYGTMRYMDGTTAEGKYIMQYGGGSSTWLQVTGSYSYSNPCILPMRAYIAPSGSGARSYTATFTDIDGKQLTSDMLLDADDSMYYDLQGRKVDTPQRKGLYIKSSVEGKNGRKVIKRR